MSEIRKISNIITNFIITHYNINNVIYTCHIILIVYITIFFFYLFPIFTAFRNYCPISHYICNGIKKNDFIYMMKYLNEIYISKKLEKLETCQK